MTSVDSDELDIDELIDKEDDSLTRQFKKAADHLAIKLLPGGVDDSKLLVLYGYYKQAFEGECNVAKPSFFDFKGKAKWEAWKKLGNLPKHEAKRKYLETIQSLDPSFNISEEAKEKEYWVKVSTMSKNEENNGNNDVTLVDLIKEGNITEVGNSMDMYEPHVLKNVVDELDEGGLGSIHWAADSGHINIIELLLKNGADINLRDSDGQTAVHYAASCGHLECVKYLLAKGAIKDVLDNEGNKAYDIASDDEIKELLKD